MSGASPTAIVVVPLYHTALSADERLSLQRTVRMLGGHDFAVICPAQLDLSPLEDVLAPAAATVERFDPSCFDGIAGYNRLMLSQALYERFDRHDYMLLCQTDVFVFRDSLLDWCRTGYDYIGAPWIASPRNVWNRAMLRLDNALRGRSRSDEHHFKVGNGGFSLRRLSTMRRIVRGQRAQIDWQLDHPGDRNHHIEDVYFSLVAPRLEPGMRIPDYREAVDFCIDRRPQRALALNDGRLPFACHGFDKRNVRRFWQPLIERELARG